ncbi:383_t:CDS:2, partial [Acaulospora morrowiae]
TGVIEIESTQFPSGFTLPDMKIHDYRWTGFWRSLEKVAGNRYTAKCSYCNYELSGRPERLHTHVLTCGSWPVAEKSSYIKETANSTPISRKKIKISSISDQEQSTSIDATDNPSSIIKHQESLMNWCVKPILQDKYDKINEKLLDTIVY